MLRPVLGRELSAYLQRTHGITLTVLGTCFSLIPFVLSREAAKNEAFSQLFRPGLWLFDLLVSVVQLLVMRKNALLWAQQQLRMDNCRQGCQAVFAYALSHGATMRANR